MHGLRTDTLRFVVGAFCVVMGTLVLVVPHQFVAGPSAARTWSLALWGALSLLTGAGLIAAATFPEGKKLHLAAHLACGAVLVALAYRSVWTGFWAGPLAWTILGLGTAVAPLLDHHSFSRSGGAGPSRERSGDLFTLIMGAIAALLGLMTLLQPQGVVPPGYAVSGPYLLLLGLVLLVGGVGLAYVQTYESFRPSKGPVIPDRWTDAALRATHVLVGGALCMYVLAVPTLSLTWVYVVHYGGLGVATAALPWLAPRLRDLDTISMRARFAVALAVAAALPLVVSRAVATGYEGRVLTSEALAQQRAFAVELAEDMAEYLRLHRSALGTLAAQPGLWRMSAQEQEALLHYFSSAFPHFDAASTYDAVGTPVAQGTNPLLASAGGQPVFEEVRQRNAPVLNRHVSPALGRPVVVIGVPIQNDAGQFAGAVVGLLESNRLVSFLARASSSHGTYAYLIDGRGRVIAHPDESLVLSQADLSGKRPVADLLAAEGRPGSLIYGSETGEYLVGYSRVPGMDWAVVVERLRDDLLDSERAGSDIAFGLMLLFIAVAVGAGRMAASRLTAPMNALAAAVDRLASGDTTAPVPSSEISEVKHLAQRFGEMRDRLAARTRELEQARTELQGLVKEVRALNAELEQRVAQRTTQLQAVIATLQEQIEERTRVEQELRRVNRKLASATRQAQMLAREAEMAERRSTFLAEVSKTLASSLDYETTMADVARSAVPMLGDYCAIDTVEEGQVRRIATVHVDPFKEEVAREMDVRYPPGPDYPDQYSRVLKTGQAYLEADVSETHLAQLARDQDQLGLLRRLGLRSYMLVPLVTRGEVLGVLTLAITEAQRRYEETELALAEDLARRCAQTVDNARLYQQAQKALAELSRTQQQIIERERLSALGQMASGIAHDFNNALSPVLGFSELLLERPKDLADKKKVRRYLELIRTGAQDAASIVNRLREFYRHREAGEVFLPVDVRRLVSQVISLTQPRWRDQALANGITIHIQTDIPQVPPILGNEADLREALTNLVFNAVDAMPEGGTIAFRTRPAGDRVILEVSDTGTGMTEEVRRRCMEPFFTTKGERGTGLGLAMVHGIVRRHEGSIDIRSEWGKGTTVALVLPAQGSRHVETGPREEEGAWRSLRVLVVDDDPLVLEVLREYLAGDGHVVEAATDGLQGLEKFRSGSFDVVVTDRAMPRMSGDQMAAILRQSTPRVPVILLSGFGEVVEGAPQRLQGVDLVLSKPVTLAALRQALTRVLPEVRTGTGTGSKVASSTQKTV